MKKYCRRCIMVIQIQPKKSLNLYYDILSCVYYYSVCTRNFSKRVLEFIMLKTQYCHRVEQSTVLVNEFGFTK